MDDPFDPRSRRGIDLPAGVARAASVVVGFFFGLFFAIGVAMVFEGLLGEMPAVANVIVVVVTTAAVMMLTYRSNIALLHLFSIWRYGRSSVSTRDLEMVENMSRSTRYRSALVLAGALVLVLIGTATGAD